MFNKIKKYLAVQILGSLNPDRLLRISQKKALMAFQKASLRIPAYKQFLNEKGISAASIRSIDDFKKDVPISDKDKTFRVFSNDIKKLCLLADIKDISTIIPSSGHSGYFSYGLNTREEMSKAQDAIDFILDYIFKVSEKHTILINSLPMGVKVSSSLVTIVDTSVRSDIVLGVIKTFSPCYDQIILVGENSFIKKVLEDGIADGIDWKKIKIHLVLGEEILPENLRTYFSDILGINPDAAESQSLIGSSFGVAEFGLNIFYETKELIRIRRLMQHDLNLREKLIGRDIQNLPALFYYNPLRVYVEEIEKDNGISNIALTNLEEEANIPLIRYNIGDEGICISFQHLKSTLVSLGYDNYVPRVRLPLAAIWGRDKILLEENFYLRPEFVKDLLYQDKDIASNITGNFRLSKTKSGLRIEIQAKNNTPLSEAFENKLKDILIANILTKTETIIYPYREFPYGIELNYEKKFQYISRD